MSLFHILFPASSRTFYRNKTGHSNWYENLVTYLISNRWSVKGSNTYEVVFLFSSGLSKFKNPLYGNYCVLKFKNPFHGSYCHVASQYYSKPWALVTKSLLNTHRIFPHGGQRIILFLKNQQQPSVFTYKKNINSLQGHHNERHGVSYHRRLDCLRSRLFRRTLKKIWKLRVTGLCEGNWSVTGDFPSQRASDAENVSIWWRHHVPSENLMATLATLLKPYYYHYVVATRVDHRKIMIIGICHYGFYDIFKLVPRSFQHYSFGLFLFSFWNMN